MESLTFYRFNHTGSFSDNYKIAFEKKGRLPQIVVAKACKGICWKQGQIKTTLKYLSVFLKTMIFFAEK